MKTTIAIAAIGLFALLAVAFCSTTDTTPVNDNQIQEARLRRGGERRFFHRGGCNSTPAVRGNSCGCS